MVLLSFVYPCLKTESIERKERKWIAGAMLVCVTRTGCQSRVLCPVCCWLQKLLGSLRNEVTSGNTACNQNGVMPKCLVWYALACMKQCDRKVKMVDWIEWCSIEATIRKLGTRPPVCQFTFALRSRCGLLTYQRTREPGVCDIFSLVRNGCQMCLDTAGSYTMICFIGANQCHTRFTETY